MNKKLPGLLAAALAFSAAAAYAADPAKLTVKVDQPGVKISPTLYGLMTEEINHSYDGGLYGELVQNRIFKDDAKTPVHWSVFTTGAQAAISLDNANPVNTTALSTALRIDISEIANGQLAGVSNDGYWGMPIRPDATYTASFYARASADFKGPLHVALAPVQPLIGLGNPLPVAEAAIPALTTDWKKYSVTLKMPAGILPRSNGSLNIYVGSKGSVWLNLVSLMPQTFNNRPNGNRIDLMEKMGGMKPAFLRMPGGNYLEGDTIADRFDWKKTIGPLENRPGHAGPWGYRSSDGLGLLEFLDWCEDLKMEPILAVFAGYSLKGERVAAGATLKPFVDDALEEIEYVTGDATTTWGKQRIKDGHPEPFKLTYVEVGNEDFFDQENGSYDRRFTQFYDAIRAKYPKLQIIATTPVRTRKPDVVDDHYYRSAREMEIDATHYDKIDRNGPKIFVGEWATTEGSPTPTMNAALGDAAWMTGMERNSDLITISCYAPLLVNVNPNARQWGTNLIGYDALQSFNSPSYYAQKMFAENRGDTVIPVDLIAPPPSAVAEPAPHGGIGLGTWATVAEYKDLKVTKADKTAVYQSDFSKGIDGWKTNSGDWKIAEGAIQQASNNTDCRTITGDAGWGDYTLTLKARKISGNEGFLILFHVKDNDNYIWWNVGGWGNTRTALEKAENGAKGVIGPSVDMKVDNNKWYDIRIEVAGRSIKCYLDDKLITQATDEPAKPGPTVFATASKEESTGEVILKLVNVQATAQAIDIDLQGVKGITKQATMEVLTGEPGDVNTIGAPEKVIPKKTTIAPSGPKFTQELPPHSVDIIRLKPE